MKKTLLLIGMLFLVILTGCKEDTAAVSELLSTVPSSAGGVMVIDLERLVKATGSKVDDHKIIPGKELQECINNYGKDLNDLKGFLAGDSGIDPKAAVMFYDSGRAYITFLLYDENKFINYVETNESGHFQETASGVKLLGNTAVKGTQAWICVSNGRRVDDEGVASYSKLKDSQSFLVTPMGEKLLVEESDIRGWGLLGTYYDEMFGSSQRMMMGVATGLLFQDGESLSFQIDFKKGKFELKARVLNDKYKPAKYLLPMEKVDVATLKGLGESCNAMMAFTLTPELVGKFEKLGTTLGGALFGNLSVMLKNVDGTVGLAASTDNDITGLITTKGEVSQDLKNFVSQTFGAVSEDGKYLKFTKGTVTGDLSVAECAESLKGSCLGLVMNSNFGSSMKGYAGLSAFKCIVIKLVPVSGSLEFEVDGLTADSKENSLITFIKK